MTKEATEVKELLERFEERDWNRYTEDTYETIEEYTRRMVEDGELIPDGEIKAELSLTLQERLTGTRKQDMTAMFNIGLLIGTALERDVPKDSKEEELWKNGEFELPE